VPRTRRVPSLCYSCQACALDAKIINEYESGKAIPNPNIINKLEKALGARLRPDKGGKGKGKK